jgi:hypothetical protein
VKPASLASKVAYGLVASCLMFSLSVAIQRTFLSPASDAGETAGESSSQTVVRASSPEVSSTAPSDDTGGRAVDVGPRRTWDPVTGWGGGAAPRQTVAPSPETARRAQAASDPPGRASWSPFAALGSLFSFGGAGVAGAPETVAPTTVTSPSPPRATGVAPLAMVDFIGMSYQGAPMQRADFSVDVLRDLRILVWWNVPGPGHVQRLDLYAPDGALYQRLTATIDETSRGRDGLTLVETSLPVAGTWITQHTLLGAWSADVFLDDGQEPAASASFAINR